MNIGGSPELFVGVQSSLKAELQTWLGHAQLTYAWGADAGVALAAPGKLLSRATASQRIPRGFWGLLPHEVAQYCATLSQDNSRIRRLALACELLLCALDYFDELEDNDSSATRSSLGDGRLLNCATALYQESLQILAELDETAYPSFAYAPRLVSIASTELRLAMSGQHLDLLSEQRPWDGFEPEECIGIIEAKSGTLCRMVCRLACAVVGTSDQLAMLFAELGTHVGIAAQLENDIHDLEQALSADRAATDQKTDLLREKKTFPLVLAYQSLQQPSPSADTTTYKEQNQQRALQAYRDAIQQAWASALFQRLSAAALAQPIEELHGKAFPPQLHAILGIDLDVR